MTKSRSKKIRNRWIWQWQWDRSLGLALLAHLLIILAVVSWGRWESHSTSGYDTVMVSDVLEGGSGGESATAITSPMPHTPSTAKTTKTSTPAIDPTAMATASQSTSDTSTGTTTGETGSVGSGAGQASGTGGARSGNAILAEIRARIERAKHYPAQAIAMHLEGHPVVEFSIQPNGTLADLQLVKSSGHRILDDAALTAVRRSVPLPYVTQRLTVPIHFGVR